MCKSCKTKLQRIVEGWTNVFIPNPEIEEISRQRATLCASCTKNKFNICTMCGCPLSAKTRSREEKCDRGLW